MKVDFKIDFSDKKTITVLTIIILLLTLLCMYSRNNAKTISNVKSMSQNNSPSTPKTPTVHNSKETSATNGKMLMYGRDSCPWCSKQKKEMGEEMKNVQYINCEQTPAACKEAKIAALPTWIINGKKHEGYIPKDKILELRG